MRCAAAQPTRTGSSRAVARGRRTARRSAPRCRTRARPAPSSASASTHSPSRPTWFASRTTASRVPCARASGTSSCDGQPRRDLAEAAGAVDRDASRRGRRPRARRPGPAARRGELHVLRASRRTPCESWPRRSASTSRRRRPLRVGRRARRPPAERRRASCLSFFGRASVPCCGCDRRDGRWNTDSRDRGRGTPAGVVVSARS